MKLFATFLALSLAMIPQAQARNSKNGEQDAVLQTTQGGEVRPLRAIENAVLPGMKAQGASYIGQEFDGDLNRYRLKFLRGRSVIWVDVDGRTGAIIGRAGG